MNTTLLHKLSAAVLIYATLVSSASAANIIVCRGGVYCEQIRLQCIAEGNSAALCEQQWRACVLDACPQR
ncbi:hypothetical protein E5C33_17665 [Stenotrophomonas maltophilia]|uniref:hypothetical protein n=1 Tax=Stenotrophomonas maltophilia TaxID=40324 RepID=UPI0010761F85|nr:hypothetical protein [Stenotrophomonas maltophilia]TFZ43596.1 hypothetical protein E5C33_17665 [Stenotrophomonas maltophilia]